mmetsp:Transcript_1865/g.4934  ORF Transcript_1865/g.4934 Transcript_1865/m.4934 type:complete len:257 (+) Transcript_1865:747-1517(+)
MHTQPLAHPSPFPSPLSPRPSPPPSPTPTPSPGPPPSPPPSLPPTPSPSPTPTPSPFPPPLPPSHTMLWPRPAQVHACARRDSAPPCCQCLRQLLNAVVWRGCSKRYACVEWHVFRCLFSSYGRFNLVQSGVGTRVTARVGLALFFPYLFSWDVCHTTSLCAGNGYPGLHTLSFWPQSVAKYCVEPQMVPGAMPGFGTWPGSARHGRCAVQRPVAGAAMALPHLQPCPLRDEGAAARTAESACWGVRVWGVSTPRC